MPTTKKSYRHSYVRKTVFTLVPILFIAVSIVLGVTNLDTIRQLLIGAAGEPANIIVDTQAILGPMPRPWRNLAQGGESNNWRLQPLISQVKALKPEYIRIDHVYDFYEIVSRDGSGRLQYNWTKIDPVVSDILATGAKPYIALSYMPSAIAVNGDIVSKSNNWGEYQQVIQRTIEHFSKERGIEDVNYEVWNEPDLFGKWSIGNYLMMYSFASRGAQQAAANGSKAFKFGGPATTALYRNWIKQLLGYVARNNLRLDFISWHRYARNIDSYRNDFSDIKNWLSASPQFSNVELHITEWGHNSDIDPGYDTSYGAAFTAAVAIEMVGNIQRGFVFEIQDGKGPSEYWGRWGLFTHGDYGAHAKPRYYALKFIDSNTGPERVSILGKGSWVKGMASHNGDSTTVVLANYDSAGQHAENVPVTFKSLAGANFVIQQLFLDGRSLRQEVATTAAELQTFGVMAPNSVAAVTITPAQTATQSVVEAGTAIDSATTSQP